MPGNISCAYSAILENIEKGAVLLKDFCAFLNDRLSFFHKKRYKLPERIKSEAKTLRLKKKKRN